MVRARGIVLDVLGGRVEPALRYLLAVDRALDENRGHLAARLVLLVVNGHCGHRLILVGVEGALEARGGGAAAGLPLLVEVSEALVVLATEARAIQQGLDVARDHVPRGIRDLLELVEELNVQGGGHFCLWGTKKGVGRPFNFLVTLLGLLDRLAHGVSLLLGLEQDKLGEVDLVVLRADVVGEAVGDFVGLLELIGGEVKR